MHTGDFTMRGDEQEVINFNQWLGTLHHKHKIVIAGNHELSFDSDFPKGQLNSERIYEVIVSPKMDYVRDGKIQGQCTFTKTEERPCISPSLS